MNFSEQKMLAGKIVKKVSFSSFGPVSFEVWEPFGIEKKHSSLARIDDVWYGRFDSRRIPSELVALPSCDEQITAASEWRKELYKEAHALIFEAYPEARAGTPFLGDIILRQKISSEEWP